MIRRLADRLAENPILFHYLRKLPEWNYRETKARLVRLRERLRPARVLDAGCGTGEFAEVFEAGRYVGVDVHPGYLRLAARLHPRHRFVCGDLLAWKGEGGPFDLALVNGVMHHHDDATARALLAAVLRQTAPGGTLVVIEDLELPGAGVATSLVHALDHGAYIRPAHEWLRLVGEFVAVEESESYLSGVCPYQLMVGRKA
jgi:SAM-dependent methyltransferase